jgi:hypothetical protein
MGWFNKNDGETKKERLDDKREWKMNKPRPLRDLLLALASVFKWFAIATIVGLIAYNMFKLF